MFTHDQCDVTSLLNGLFYSHFLIFIWFLHDYEHIFTRAIQKPICNKWTYCMITYEFIFVIMNLSSTNALLNYILSAILRFLIHSSSFFLNVSLWKMVACNQPLHDRVNSLKHRWLFIDFISMSDIFNYNEQKPS